MIEQHIEKNKQQKLQQVNLNYGPTINMSHGENQNKTKMENQNGFRGNPTQEWLIRQQKQQKHLSKKTASVTTIRTTSTTAGM